MNTTMTYTTMTTNNKPRQNPPLAATQNEDHHIAEIPIESSSAVYSTHEPTHIEPAQRETTYELTYPVVASVEPAYVAAASTEDTHPEPTNPEDTYSVSNHSEKPRLLKSFNSKMQLSNFCCRWDIPNISTINFLSLEKEGTRQTLIIQNKPNFEKKQNELSPFLITTNSQKPPTRTAKNKPNTNPIQSHSKPIQTHFKANSEPIKTQSKPISKGQKPKK
jgi:hypothetical protein